MADQKNPNVILIIMDDLCWGDLSCHGNPHIQTPALDQMHGESARLTRYCSGPLCSPARASIMTGRYHLRTRVIDTYLGRSMIDPGETTLAQMFHASGYRTGCFGKWHLGDNVPNRPQDLGFDEVLVHRGGGIGQPGDCLENYGRESYFDPWLFHNGTAKPYAGYCTDIFADATAEFARACRKDDAPFFAYLATNAPHTPLQVADEWADPFREMGLPEEHARLYGMVANIDWNVGRLLACLEEEGLADNTIVIYTSDHGPCGSARARSAPEGKQDRWNADLRGIKGSVYEGGIRVPCFWRLPGRIVAGHDVETVASPIDVLPTLASLCEIDIPGDNTPDGKDLSALLTGGSQTEELRERALFMQWHRGDQPVAHRNRAVIRDRWKLIRNHESEPDELYDLFSDPAEQTNRCSSEPAIAESMARLYNEWFADVSSTRPDNYAPPPIHIGDPRCPWAILTRQDWRIHGLDGWGDQNIGHWVIEAVNAGAYSFELIFAQPMHESFTVYLQIDGVCHQAYLSRGEKRLEFDALELGDGSHRIEAWAKSATAACSALYVNVKPTP